MENFAAGAHLTNPGTGSAMDDDEDGAVDDGEEEEEEADEAGGAAEPAPTKGSGATRGAKELRPAPRRCSMLRILHVQALPQTLAGSHALRPPRSGSRTQTTQYRGVYKDMRSKGGGFNANLTVGGGPNRCARLPGPPARSGSS